MFDKNESEKDVIAIVNDYVNTFNAEVFVPLRQFNRTPDATIFQERDAMVIILKTANNLLKNILPKNVRVKEIRDNNDDILKKLQGLNTDANYSKNLSILSALVQAQVERHKVVFSEIVSLMTDYSDTFNREVFLPIRVITRNSAATRGQLAADLSAIQIVLKRGNKVLEGTFSGSNRMKEVIDNNSDMLDEVEKLEKSLAEVDKRLKNLSDLVQVQTQRNQKFLNESQSLSRAA